MDQTSFDKFQTTSNGLQPLVLVACGSYSPVTNMHLRLFEDARNTLKSEFDIVAGIVSPVHDAYGKHGLASADQRIKMLQLATQHSDWIDVWSWETQQAGWTRTVEVLEQYDLIIKCNYLPNVLVALLCGADLLESMTNATVWTQEEVERILSQFGLAVMERQGIDIEKIISKNDVLSKHRDHIFVIPQRVVNTVSSSLVRELISEGMSINYLVPDEVVKYISDNLLYDQTF